MRAPIVLRETYVPSELAVTVLLPRELVPRAISNALQQLCCWIDGQLGGRQFITIEDGALMQKWASLRPRTVTQAEMEAMPAALGTYGYGIEPDVRFGGPAVGPGPAVLYDGVTSKCTPGPGWPTAAGVIKLAAAVWALPRRRTSTL